MEKKYVYLSYCTGSGLPEITRAQAKKLTHLCIAFGHVRQSLMNVDKIRHWLPYVQKIREYNPELAILLSTGGGSEGGHAEATSTPAKLSALVESCMDIVREYDLDGIDCDWEFPCDTGDMNEKYNYTALLRAYRAELNIREKLTGRKMWLTAAWYPNKECFNRCEVDKVLEVMDFINIMSYDLNEHCPGGAPSHTGHHSNVYAATGDYCPLSCEYAVKIFNEAGIPNDKLVLGAAFYSKQWNGVPDINHGLHQQAETRCVHGPGYAVIRASYEVNPDYIKYWDDEAKACWLYNGYNFITYEDPRAMKEKCEFVKAQNLRGIMYWAHDYDSSSVLFNVIYDNMFL